MDVSIKTQPRENERRDSVIVIIVILLLGFICIILASGWALRFAPSWKLDTNMGSNLNPNSDFLTSRPVSFIEPLDPAILTNPAWMDVFLTPGAALSLPTRTPLPASTATLVLVKTSTPLTTTTVTATTVVNPTNTLIYFPPIRTSTPRPPSTNTPITPVTSVTPLPSADLQIFKTDGSLTYIPGNTITYTIVVSNAGPSNAIGASVVDAIPASITGTTINCVASGTASCGTNASVSNNLTYTGVNIPVGAGNFLTITTSGTVNSATTGNLVNTATVTVGAGYTDPTPGNNFAIDTDTANPQTDLAITKTDGSLTYIPGNPITYTIVVANTGPSNAVDASVADVIPTAITGTTINCVASGTASCGTNGSVGNNLSFTGVSISAGAGNFLTITASGTVSLAATGNLANTATVMAGTGQTDPAAGNNSATDTNTQFVPPSADLQISKTDGVATYTPGGAPLIYTITVTNSGPDAVTGAAVTDNFPAQITSANWTCATTGLATCGAPSGSGNINQLVDLPVGSTVTYTVTANTSANAVGTLANTATVTVPVGATETNAGNNTATDSDTSTSTDPNIGPRDGGYISPGPNSIVTILFSPPIVANGDGTYDFVYYERVANPLDPPANWLVALDWVQIEISADGIMWYQVLYWGDPGGVPDTNTNVDLSLVGDLCPTEIDNCNIPVARLYNLTGIQIDVDGIVPPGNYPWMRITSPPGGANGTDIDAIEIILP